MIQFSYKMRRNLLFEYLSSIELDMRSFVKEYSIPLNSMIDKVRQRFNDNNYSEELFEEEKYNFLDFGDYSQLISSFFKEQKNHSKVHNELLNELSKLTPIRNRVMHSRPLLAEDDINVFAFVKKYNEFNTVLCFENLKRSIDLIESNPSIFFEKTPSFDKLYIQKSIEHNLPMVDYDDTGFVGREDIKNRIIKKIKSAYPIISIIGDGGIGKTSTVLSCIYDYMDQSDFPFEKVIWVSLKTKALLDGEFKEIKNTFKSFSSFIEHDEFFKKEGTTTIEMLLFFMKVYKTLLILDNLETINSEDIRDLFEEIPQGSKIIITSRIGIGEYESRLVLPKFDAKEADFYFRKLVNVYNVKVLEKIKSNEITKYISRLYYSPLCIKWFVINVGKGNNPDIIVNSQDELIEYCLSNVYDKLSNNAKYVIKILLIKQVPCSIAEIVYINNSDYVKSFEAINELCACNFLEQVEYGVYNVPDFAKKYLNKKNDDKLEFDEIRKKNDKLVGTIENLQTDKHLKEKNHPLSLFPADQSEKIATIYMLKFMEASKQNNFEEMQKLYDAASKAAPKYSDFYKVSAYLYSKIGQYSLAMDNYELALDYAKSEEDKAYIQNMIALYYLGVKNNYEEAEKMILEALNRIPDNPYFHANYARVLKFEKKFDEALGKITELFNSQFEIPDYLKRILYSEYVDINIRKIDDVYNDEEKSMLFDKLSKFILKINYEYYSINLYKEFSKIIKEMLFLNNRINIRKIIKSFYEKYFPYILFVENNNQDFKYFVETLSNVLSIDIDLLNYCCQFPKEEIGIIEKTFPEKGYGFISIKKWSTGLFFHFSQLQNTNYNAIIGDRVKFIPYYKNGRWSAISICLANSIEEDEDE